MTRCKTDKCLLCKINDANETNSHIVPRMIAKTISDYKPSKERGNEIEFGISVGEGSKTFVGAGVGNDKLEELYGEDYQIDDLPIEQDLYALDYIFCKSCEKKFGTIETVYAEYLMKSKIPVHYSYLFWMSIIVRISLTKFCGRDYPKKMIKTLTNQLNDYLTEDVKVFKKQDFSKLQMKPFYIIKCETIKSDSYVIDGPQNQLPIRLVAGQFVIILYDKNKQVKNTNWSFFGFEKHLNQEAFNNTQFEKTTQISEEQFKTSLTRITEFMKDKTIKRFNSTIDYWVNQLSSGKMKKAPQIIKNTIIARLTKSDRGLADKFTVKALSEETRQLFLELGWMRP